MFFLLFTLSDGSNCTSKGQNLELNTTSHHDKVEEDYELAYPLPDMTNNRNLKKQTQYAKSNHSNDTYEVVVDMHGGIYEIDGDDDNFQVNGSNVSPSQTDAKSGDDMLVYESYGNTPGTYSIVEDYDAGTGSAGTLEMSENCQDLQKQITDLKRTNEEARPYFILEEQSDAISECEASDYIAISQAHTVSGSTGHNGLPNDGSLHLEVKAPADTPHVGETPRTGYIGNSTEEYSTINYANKTKEYSSSLPQPQIQRPPTDMRSPAISETLDASHSNNDVYENVFSGTSSSAKDLTKAKAKNNLRVGANRKRIEGKSPQVIGEVKSKGMSGIPAGANRKNSEGLRASGQDRTRSKTKYPVSEASKTRKVDSHANYTKQTMVYDRVGNGGVELYGKLNIGDKKLVIGNEYDHIPGKQANVAVT